MEWMWAAMGADKTAQPNTTGYNKAFAGSNGSNSVGNYAYYSSISSSMTHEVGTKMANELNLSDMSGNVHEWVWDWRGDYSDGTLTDPAVSALDLTRVRVFRGGSWNDDTSSCTVAYRDGYTPYGGGSLIGFRVLAAAQ
jgi:formylglycine-generating enzyme required for sulfatase activity